MQHFLSGEEDKVLPYEDNGGYINEHAPQSCFELLKGEVGHPIFLNCPSKLGRENLAAEIIEDPPSIDRGEIHSKVSHMAIHFFSENL